MSHTETQPIEQQPDAGVEEAALTPRERVIRALDQIKRGVAELTSLEAVEDMALEVMDSLPESMELAEQLEVARTRGDRESEEEVIGRRRVIYDEVVGELALIAGIETDDGRVERENAEYRHKAADTIAGITQEDIESGDALVKLGMLVGQEDGKLVFTYPRDLFPPHITEKWDHYIGLVSRHVSLIASGEIGKNDTDLIVQFDLVRTAAHNNLSLAIKEFLQLHEWDLERCRHLVIKMRDARMPTVESAEKELTSQGVAEFVATVRALTQNPATS